MTDHTDLIARLRGPVPHTKGFNEIFVDTDRNKAVRIEAADALEAQRAENERLREALRGLLVQFPPINWTPVAGEAQATVSVASLAVASAALAR